MYVCIRTSLAKCTCTGTSSTAYVEFNIYVYDYLYLDLTVHKLWLLMQASDCIGHIFTCNTHDAHYN